MYKPTEKELAKNESYYAERIGKVYGDYEVTNVTYDWERRCQIWEMRCIKCGDTRITRNGKEYVKGRVKGLCKKCATSNKKIT